MLDVAPLSVGLLEFIEAKAAKEEERKPPIKSTSAAAANDYGQDEFRVQKSPEPYSEAGMYRLMSMLAFLIRPGLLKMNGRPDWLQLGMALHHLGWPYSRWLWDYFSRLAEPRESDGGGTFDLVEQDKAWNSFVTGAHKGPPKTIASYYKIAMDAGWVWNGDGCDAVGDECTASSEREPDAASSAYQDKVATLATLPQNIYDGMRKEVAKQQNVRLSTLDADVAKLRPREERPGQGSVVELPEAEPWPEPVDIRQLIEEITSAIRRHVFLTVFDAQAIALWVLASHVYDAFDSFPRLRIRSPEKRCGKTTLLMVVEALVHRPLSTEDISAPALFRTIEEDRPTLLIDEVDAGLKDNEDMRSLINSGHRRGGKVIRLVAVGDNFERRAFSTFAPMVLSGIGALAATIEDRSITINMKRRLPGETVERLRSTKMGHLAELNRKARRFAEDVADQLLDPDPDLPDELHDRAQDNWRPLVAVANLASDGWPSKARAAALVLEGEMAKNERDAAAAMLLADIRDMFEALANDPALFVAHGASKLGFSYREGGPVKAQQEQDRARSADVAFYLNSLVDRPWSGWNRGRGITPANIAKQLSEYGIQPKCVRVGGERPNGYIAADFEEAFHRFLPVKRANSTSAEP